MKNRFLSNGDVDATVQAIIQSEMHTSGEIRVHIDDEIAADPLERATRVFHELDIHLTKKRNGVLFYVGIKDHSFAIVGDEGIHNVVGSDFWDCTKDIVITHFKKGEFKEGLVNGILNVGIKLKEFFPFEDNDQNELPNDVSGL